MAIIVAILSFQMDTGVWTVEQSFRAALLNPVYLPQLLFRTPLAMVTAGLFGMFLTWFLTRGRGELRATATRFLSVWTLAWSGPWLLGAWAYYRAVPAPDLANLGVALGSMQFESLHRTLIWLIALAVGFCLLVAVWGLLQPRRLPGFALLVPGVLSIWLLGHFERVREFVRKPDVIAAYMYSNALRSEEYALYREQGLLPHATYAAVREVTDENRLLAGREMFRLACSRCHTTRGMNGVVEKFADMYGPRPWNPADIAAYLGGMHNTRPFMPPVPGNDHERAALAEYLVALRDQPATLHGAQTAGAPRRDETY
jgi:mono/diheme cytochrome c family protein